MPDNQSIQELLECNKIKPTTQRIEIAKVIMAEPQHLSAEQVLARVNARAELVSKATVYNTLNLFVKKGLINQLIIDPSKVFYDSNTASHYHFYNEDTGKLSDFSASDINLNSLPSLPDNTEKSGIDIIIRVRNTR